MDFSVQQIVLGELDEELSLSQRVDCLGSHEQFLIGAHHGALLRPIADASGYLLSVIRDEVGLWDLIDGL